MAKARPVASLTLLGLQPTAELYPLTPSDNRFPAAWATLDPLDVASARLAK